MPICKYSAEVIIDFKFIIKIIVKHFVKVMTEHLKTDGVNLKSSGDQGIVTKTSGNPTTKCWLLGCMPIAHHTLIAIWIFQVPNALVVYLTYSV